MEGAVYRTGIVLSGGGARGFAHLGVLQALNESGIFPDVISGTSAGAIVSVLYADGYTPAQIMEIFNSTSRLHYISPAMSRAGLLKISGILKILRENLRAKNFEELQIPAYVCATDLNNGKAVYFSKGEIIATVIASASIPVLFKPVKIDNISYADGGVLDNLPVFPVEKSCRLLIGSFVNPTGFEENFSSLIRVAERTFMLNVAKETALKAGKFDLYIAPQVLKDYKILDPEKSREVFNIGLNETRKLMKEKNFMKLFNESAR
jgi:NTE family protein